MLTDEQAQEIFANEHCNISKELAGILARAIEAAVLPEGLVAVPKEPSDELLIEMNRHYSMRHAYQAMIAFVLKAQAEKREENEMGNNICAKCHHWNGGVVLCEHYAEEAERREVERQAEKQEQDSGITFEEYAKRKPHLHKQEPVKDEPVTCIVSSNFCECDKRPLYARPQPDFTAEVERLKLSAEHWNRLYRERCQEFHDAQTNKRQEIVWLINRIAELKEAAREARDALQYHTSQTRPIFNTTEAIAKLDAVLGNA